MTERPRGRANIPSCSNGSQLRPLSPIIRSDLLFAMPANCVKASIKGRSIMDRFENVTVIKKANVYFNGNVTSRTVLFQDGTKKTLGVMMPGHYEFSTADKEIMEMLSGNVSVLLPGAKEWKSFGAGQTFEVPANSKFKVNVGEVSDYCCSYIKA